MERGFGFNAPEPLAGLKSPLARIGRVRNYPACSPDGPGLEQVWEGRQVTADGLLGCSVPLSLAVEAANQID